MSGRPDSYIPLYIGDYLADTGHLTTTEHGAYLLLLFHYWIKGPASSGGGLPDEDKVLASIAKLAPKQWAPISATLRAFFSPAVINGRKVLVQKRMEQTLESVIGKFNKKMSAIDAANAAKEAARQRVGQSASGFPDAAADAGAYANADAGAYAGASGPHLAPVKPEPEPEPDILKSKPSLRSGSSAGADPPDEPTASKPRGTKPPDQYADVRISVEIYNEIAAPLRWAKCEKVTQKRFGQMRQRLADCGGVEGWRAAMKRAAESPFLRGETGRSNEHENWRPDIDFFLAQSSFIKLIEGKYDGQKTGVVEQASGHDEQPTPEQLITLKDGDLRRWANGEPWKYARLIGPPPDDPATKITAEDLARVPAARERLQAMIRW